MTTLEFHQRVLSWGVVCMACGLFTRTPACDGQTDKQTIAYTAIA